MMDFIVAIVVTTLFFSVILYFIHRSEDSYADPIHLSYNELETAASNTGHSNWSFGIVEIEYHDHGIANRCYSVVLSYPVYIKYIVCIRKLKNNRVRENRVNIPSAWGIKKL